MSENWLRSYVLTVGPAGGSGIEITELHISFSFSKSETESANTGTISVWNLNKDHEKMVVQRDCCVELKAGYENGQMPTLFRGYVTYGYTEPDGADRKTTLECVDGRVESRDTYISKSYSGSTNNKKIIDDIATEMGIDVSYADDCNFGDIPNGYSFVGQAIESLDKACAVSDLVWTIDNGTLNIKKTGSTMSKTCFKLSSETGLVGTPKKFLLSGTYENDDMVFGYEVQYFLNAGINISDYVFLDSKEVEGYFMVSAIDTSGDNMSGDWLCTAKLIENEQKEQSQSRPYGPDYGPPMPDGIKSGTRKVGGSTTHISSSGVSHGGGGGSFDSSTTFHASSSGVLHGGGGGGF